MWPVSRASLEATADAAKQQGQTQQVPVWRFLRSTLLYHRSPKVQQRSDEADACIKYL